jgi:tRNA A-37 threonylcarbamoyl transferase component Bud32
VSERDPRARVLTFLRNQWLLAEDEEAPMSPLDGGVSSDLWKVETPAGVICVKGALAQLKVAQEWFAPVSRNRVEYEYLRFAARVCPGQIPRVIAQDSAAGLFAMEYLPPERYPVWKTALLAGHVDGRAAEEVGSLVGRLHAASALDEASPVRFANDDNFDALRIDPFFRSTARAHPDLRPRLDELAQRTAHIHAAVVHGDVSPKNILLGPDGPVLLDAECAWFGDPAFDVAFCVNHLLLKSVRLPHVAEDLRESARRLVAAHAVHIDWEPAGGLDERVATLLPVLALARIDGISPVEYLDDSQKEGVRAVARQMLHEPVSTVTQALSQWAGLADLHFPAHH